MKRVSALSIGFILSVALFGCSPGGAPDAASSTSPSPGPAPEASATASTPAPPANTDAPEPRRIVISAEAIQVIVGDESPGEAFTYFQPIEDVVAALTTTFGADPVVTQHSDAPFPVDYTWNGFRIGADGRGQAPFDAESIVVVSAPEVHGIAIETVEGIRVGDPAAPLEAAYPEDSHRWMYEDVERVSISVGSVSIAAGEEREFSVNLTAHPADGAVTSFLAPHKNFE